jgi:hypothetical protein
MNLRSRESWRSFVNPKTGEPAKDVIESLDQAFTICESKSMGTKVYVAWFRRPKPQMADIVGGYQSADLARDACARYAERVTA